jgi:hypothetical protein
MQREFREKHSKEFWRIMHQQNICWILVWMDELIMRVLRLVFRSLKIWNLLSIEFLMVMNLFFCCFKRHSCSSSTTQGWVLIANYIKLNRWKEQCLLDEKSLVIRIKWYCLCWICVIIYLFLSILVGENLKIIWKLEDWSLKMKVKAIKWTQFVF